jgi:sec-independent protein translocase protein TatC
MRKLLRSIWRLLTAPFRFIAWILRAIFRWFNNLYRRIKGFLTEEVEDEPLPDTFAKTMENPSGLLEHVDALRKHLLRIVFFLFITTSISFAFSSQIIDWLAQPIGGIQELQAIDVTEPLSVFMRVSLFSGFAFALPYIALELWLFAAPGLRKKERIFGLVAIPLVFVFFVGGLLFAYYFMLPTAIPFLLNFMNIPTIPRPSTYIGFVTSIMFWIGLIFEFPLVIYVLASMGLVDARFLINHWRLAMVIIAIAAAAITPTVDPISMGLVMAPMIALYFLSIGLAFIAQRGRRLQQEAVSSIQ